MSEINNVASSTMMQFNEEVVERRLAFKPDPEIGNLCMGYINDVRIDIREVSKLNEDGTENTWEYAGCKFPTMVIEFKQAKSDANPKDRYYTFTVKPVTTLNKNGEPVQVDKIVSIMQQEYARLRHIANQFKGVKGYPTNAGGCPGIDYAAAPEVRVAQYTAFFEYFKNLLVGENPETPIYKGVKLWMKLVADYSTGKYLAFPGFVGRGFIERVIQGQNTTLEFEANETVALTKSTKENKREAAINNGIPAMDAGATDPSIQSVIDKYSK